MSGHGEEKGSATPTINTHSFIGGLVKIAAVVLALILAFVAFGQHAEEEKVRNTEDIRVAQRAYDDQRAYAAAAQQDKCRGPYRWIELHSVPDSGIAEYLCPGWKTFPLGGSKEEGGITISAPHLKTPLKDAPGVDNYFGNQPEGNYIFRPDPLGSKRGVRIYTR